MKKFNVLGIVCTHNAQHYIKTFLEYYFNHGIDIYLIDNESTDYTLSIAKNYLNKNNLFIDTYKFTENFELYNILEFKEIIAKKSDYSWFIHLDIDEILEAEKFQNLNQVICKVDRLGYNCINFNEFVFIPESKNLSYINQNYYNKMRLYYFFEPAQNRLNRAWKKIDLFDLKSSGGHNVKFNNKKIYPQNFHLRHYICLSYEHLLTKYKYRKFNQDEINKGWHLKRLNIKKNNIYNFKINSNFFFTNENKSLITNSPIKNHFWDLSNFS